MTRGRRGQQSWGGGFATPHPLPPPRPRALSRLPLPGLGLTARVPRPMLRPSGRAQASTAPGRGDLQPQCRICRSHCQASAGPVQRAAWLGDSQALSHLNAPYPLDHVHGPQGRRCQGTPRPPSTGPGPAVGVQGSWELTRPGPAPAPCPPRQPKATHPTPASFWVPRAASGLRDGRAGLGRLLSWLTSPQPHWGAVQGVNTGSILPGLLALRCHGALGGLLGHWLILSLGLSSRPSRRQAGRW